MLQLQYCTTRVHKDTRLQGQMLPTPKPTRSCSMMVICISMVGRKRQKTGIHPLKNPRGPSASAMPTIEDHTYAIDRRRVGEGRGGQERGRGKKEINVNLKQ